MRIILSIMILALCLTSCSSNTIISDSFDNRTQPLSQKNSPTQSNELLNEVNYVNQFETFHCTSVEEIYDILENISTEMSTEIKEIENMYISDISNVTLVQQNELKNGIFENFRQKLLEENKVMIPFFDNSIAITNSTSEYNIEIYPSGSCLKPWILYYTDCGLLIKTMYYDTAFNEEANQKGASWLKSKLDPYGMNVYNFEEYKQTYLSQGYTYCEHTTVYEKEYTLGDRVVTAMVIDNSERPDYPNVNVYFVYDDIFVCVYGTPEEVENNIGKLTFYEVDLETGTQINDYPGRNQIN